jgi:DNA-directed RNA polymerase
MAATIQDQLAHEHNMVYRGIERYRSQQQAAQESRNEESSAGSTLLRHYVLPIADHINLYLDGKHPAGRRRGKGAKLMATVDTDKIALIALRSIINAFYSPRSLTSLCVSIGGRCEDELRFVHFQTEYKEYYDSLIRDFRNKNLVNYKHQRNVLKAKGADRGLQWVDWSNADKADVGSLIISLLMEVCDLVEREDTLNSRRQTEAHIVPTKACIEWIENHNAAVEIVSPDRMPCLIPPMDWVSNTDGGFYSPELRGRTPLIKANYRDHSRVEMYNNADMTKVFAAINGMQRTGWRVNTRVHDTMKHIWANNLECGMPRSEPLTFPECPVDESVTVADLPESSDLKESFMLWKGEMRTIYTMEKERRAKNLALLRTMRLANELLEHEEFFYVYQTDFRGRVYATASGLNPQGTDHSKSLIEFSEGKPLGETGMHWFMVNGANKFGYDKASYDDRVAYMYKHAAKWLAAGTDPIANRGVWTEADKPFQFLAWCFEFADAMSLDDHREFVSHLPVGLDGSCNGLQHFSAMLRDSVGGSAVNLTPADLPADIYQRVGDVCYAKLKASDDPAAKNWIWLLGDSMPRSLPKAPVMTLPYGSTQQACTATTYKWLKEKAEREFPENTAFKQCIFLTPILWESIGEVVIAARAAMKWIQDSASIISRAGHDIQYTSPIGFPVLQRKMKYTSKQIETQIGGRLQIRIGTDTDKVDLAKQRQGSSPNLVHHSDATHMMMTILACLDAGITSFAMIHDDFGTHACDAGEMQRIISETFVDLHKNHNILEDFKRVHEARHDIVLPDLPDTGDLCIESVLKSNYFFG